MVEAEQTMEECKNRTCPLVETAEQERRPSWYQNRAK